MFGRSKPRIALHGAVYGKNFGDTLIQKIVADQIRDRLDAQVFFPAGTRDFAAMSGERVGGRWRLSGSRAVVFGPGGYLGERRDDQETWHRRLQEYHGELMSRVVRHKLPLAVYGVGVGPISDPASRKLVASILDYAGLIHLRDEESAEYARSELDIAASRISVGPDVALSLSRSDHGATASPNTGETARVVLHIPQAGKDISGNYERMLADLLDFARSRRDTTFHIVADSPGNKFPEFVRTDLLALPNVTFLPYAGPSELLREIGKSSVVVSTKLHVGICAVALGVPAVSTFFHPKVERFFAQIQKPERAIDITRYSTGWVAKALTKAMAAPTALTDEVPDALRAQAKSDFARLEAFLRKTF